MEAFPAWLIGIHAALQAVLCWSRQDTTALILWFLLWVGLVVWGLVLALAYSRVTPDSPQPPWPVVLQRLLNGWPLAAALFPALLGLAPVIPQGLRGLFRVSLLWLIATVTLYGQARSKAEQQREQRRQLVAFADRAADLFRAEGDRLLAGIERKALEEAIAAEESLSGQEEESNQEP